MARTRECALSVPQHDTRDARRRRPQAEPEPEPETSPTAQAVLVRPAPLSHAIAQSLALDIVESRLLQGRKLDETTLTRRFRVSRSRVRDALRALAAMGLVTYLPRRGLSVIEINVEELDDLFEAASEIEALCARLCAMQ